MNGTNVDAGDLGKGQDADCRRPIQGLELDDVEACAYYRGRRELPSVGTPVELRPRPGEQRLGVETEEGELVGYLPARAAYLMECLALGHLYSGRVAVAGRDAAFQVAVDLTART